MYICKPDSHMEPLGFKRPFRGGQFRGHLRVRGIVQLFLSGIHVLLAFPKTMGGSSHANTLALPYSSYKAPAMSLHSFWEAYGRLPTYQLPA